MSSFKGMPEPMTSEVLPKLLMAHPAALSSVFARVCLWLFSASLFVGVFSKTGRHKTSGALGFAWTVRSEYRKDARGNFPPGATVLLIVSVPFGWSEPTLTFTLVRGDGSVGRVAAVEGASAEAAESPVRFVYAGSVVLLSGRQLRYSLVPSSIAPGKLRMHGFPRGAASFTLR